MIVGADPEARGPILHLERAGELRHEDEVEHAAGLAGDIGGTGILHLEEDREEDELFFRERQAEEGEFEIRILGGQCLRGDEGVDFRAGESPDVVAIAADRDRLAYEGGVEAEFVGALDLDLERLACGVCGEAGGFVKRQHGGEGVVLRAGCGDEDFGEWEEDFADDVVGVFLGVCGDGEECQGEEEEGEEFFGDGVHGDLVISDQ